jgi:hypothetical protein
MINNDSIQKIIDWIGQRQADFTGMAVTAVELFSDPAHLVKIRQEFEMKTQGRTYTAPVPEDAKPPHYEPGSA